MAENNPTLLVLAAGMGSRYGGLKQVDPVGPSGETLLDYSVYDAVRSGFDKVVFLIRRDIEAVFKEKVGKRYEGKVNVEYAFQELTDVPIDMTISVDREKPWGTMHAVWSAREAIDRNFGVINADDFYGRESYKKLADYLRQSSDNDVADWSMVGFTLGKTLSDHGAVNRGICEMDDEGYLVKAVETLKIEKGNGEAKYPGPDGETKTLDYDTLVSMNMWGFTPSVFPMSEQEIRDFLRERGNEAKSEIYIPPVVEKLIAEGRARCKVLHSGENWFGVTYPEDKPKVVEEIGKLIEKGVYPEKLWG